MGCLFAFCRSSGVLEPVGHLGRAKLGAWGVHTAAGDRGGGWYCLDSCSPNFMHNSQAETVTLKLSSLLRLDAAEVR
jgi:hypothetical protein